MTHSWSRMLTSVLFLAVTASGIVPPRRATADEHPPAQLRWREGDLAGLTWIVSPDGRKVIGVVELHQYFEKDVLRIRRVARFFDGSSDEDQLEVRSGKTLETIGGRMIIRDTKARPTVDLTIDIAGDRIHGFSGLGKEREEYDEKVELSSATYWGPLVFVLVKSFEQNASENRLVFQTVVATPKPRVLDMELLRQDKAQIRLRGTTIPATKYVLRPTINPVIDPIVRMFAPDTFFFVQDGKPPSWVRFEGPRNYAGQKIRIE